MNTELYSFVSITGYFKTNKLFPALRFKIRKKLDLFSQNNNIIHGFQKNVLTVIQVLSTYESIVDNKKIEKITRGLKIIEQTKIKYEFISDKKSKI